MEMKSESNHRLPTRYLLPLFVAISGVLFFQCSVSGKIHGGNEENIANIPYIVALSSPKMSNLFFCGGTIISASWILTAAHCLLRVEANEVYIRAGTRFMHKGGQVRNVTRIIRHELFSHEIRVNRDFALLELDAPLQLRKTVRPIDLYDFNDRYVPGEMCLVSGWGKTETSKGPKKRLHSVMVPLVKHDDCKAVYARFGTVLSGQMLCAGGEPGKDSCVGDSGGPLVCRDKLVGVVSWGRRCGSHYGIYGNVSTVRGWVIFHTGI
ncbi:trypsin 3A1-like [Toxorhynchites rutilus septentrionalis]|uniref:trypsin 3A1-like n=1 Tax=Toxorhynchites rutilus septentrionalis TaxID=329112 RepID=UPI0024797D77|nr:trypsin 3A1-like [Toxorhynchites rutilus septentrionalis]